MICDLHVHSDYSDGTCTPSEIVRISKDNGLSAVALCDHNTVDGIESFVKEGERQGINTVAGIEFSTAYNGEKHHILGLFIPVDKIPEINRIMSAPRERKEKNNLRLVENLYKDGYKVDYDKIKEENKKAYINRAHIASALVKEGYASDVSEAFRKILCDYWFKSDPERLKSLEIISYIRSIGAVPVWAHPFVNRDSDLVESFLPLAIEAGLMGIETRYTFYDAKTQAQAESLALKYNLYQSGGSDFHGTRKPEIQLGKGLGNLQIPYEFYRKMQKLNPNHS